jgi:hypothetical protein
VSKERSSRRAPIKKVARNRARAKIGGQAADVRMSPQGLGGYREFARAQVLAAWPQILQGLIEKATSGGYQHTKLLLDLSNLATREAIDPSQDAEEQLCDVLLDNLRLRPRE